MKLSRRRLVLVLALAACACGDRRAPAPAGASASPRAGSAASAGATGNGPLVVFLGDSITAGLRVEPDEAFPAVVQRELAAEGRPFRLVNAGVSGDTSAGGLRRLDWLLAQEPAVLVVELGGNDGLRGQPVTEVEANLRAIVQRAETAGTRVLLLGVRLPPSLGAAYTQGFAALYEELAHELGCASVPFFMEGVGGNPELMDEDGLHPNRDGHARIAENVAPELARVLESLPAQH